MRVNSENQVIATWYYPGQVTNWIMLRCYSVMDASHEVKQHGH